MTSECNICFRPYTSSDTTHAPYSTTCGHLMGKECLEKMKEYSDNSRFNCPFCNKENDFAECHPIYGINDEHHDTDEKVSNNTTNDKSNTTENLKETKNFIILQDYNHYIGGFIKFFDEHNGYILIGGHLLTPSRQFIKIIDVKQKKIHNVSKFSTSDCNCLAFNKHENENIEFCAGFKDGTIKWFTCSIVHNCLIRISSKKLVNFDIQQIFFNNSKLIINSLCFLTKDSVLFSIGKGTIRLWDNKNDTLLSNTKIIKDFSCYGPDRVTDLKSTKSGVCLGIMNDTIYVFEENGNSYKLIDESESGREIISYSVDPNFSTLLVFYSDKMMSGKNNLTYKSHIMYEIQKKTTSDKETPILEKYVAIKLRSSSNYIKKFPKSFRTPFFSVENSSTLIHYGFLPNIKKGKIEITTLYDELQCKQCKKIRNLTNCLGVTFAGPNQFCLKTNSRIKIVVVLRYTVKIMDICYIDKS